MCFVPETFQGVLFWGGSPFFLSERQNQKSPFFATDDANFFCLRRFAPNVNRLIPRCPLIFHQNGAGEWVFTRFVVCLPCWRLVFPKISQEIFHHIQQCWLEDHTMTSKYTQNSSKNGSRGGGAGISAGSGGQYPYLTDACRHISFGSLAFPGVNSGCDESQSVLNHTNNPPKKWYTPNNTLCQFSKKNPVKKSAPPPDFGGKWVKVKVKDLPDTMKLSKKRVFCYTCSLKFL